MNEEHQVGYGISGYENGLKNFIYSAELEQFMGLIVSGKKHLDKWGKIKFLNPKPYTPTQRNTIYSASKLKVGSDHYFFFSMYLPVEDSVERAAYVSHLIFLKNLEISGDDIYSLQSLISEIFSRSIIDKSVNINYVDADMKKEIEDNFRSKFDKIKCRKINPNVDTISNSLLKERCYIGSHNGETESIGFYYTLIFKKIKELKTVYQYIFTDIEIDPTKIKEEKYISNSFLLENGDEKSGQNKFVNDISSIDNTKFREQRHSANAKKLLEDENSNIENDKHQKNSFSENKQIVDKIISIKDYVFEIKQTLDELINDLYENSNITYSTKEGQNNRIKYIENRLTYDKSLLFKLKVYKYTIIVLILILMALFIYLLATNLINTIK